LKVRGSRLKNSNSSRQPKKGSRHIGNSSQQPATAASNRQKDSQQPATAASNRQKDSQQSEIGKLAEASRGQERELLTTNY